MLTNASLGWPSHKVRRYTAFAIHGDTIMHHEAARGMAWTLEPPKQALAMGMNAMLNTYMPIVSGSEDFESILVSFLCLKCLVCP